MTSASARSTVAFRKELRSLRPYLCASVGAVLLEYVCYTISAAIPDPVLFIPFIGVLVGLVWRCVALPMAAIALFGAESEGGTLESLLALPIPRCRVWLTKMAAFLVVAGACLAMNCILYIGLRGFLVRYHVKWEIDGIAMMLLFGTLMTLLWATGPALVCSLGMRDQLKAAAMTCVVASAGCAIGIPLASGIVEWAISAQPGHFVLGLLTSILHTPAVDVFAGLIWLAGTCALAYVQFATVEAANPDRSARCLAEFTASLFDAAWAPVKGRQDPLRAKEWRIIMPYVLPATLAALAMPHFGPFWGGMAATVVWLLIAMAAAASFGAELTLQTGHSMLAQPIARERLWQGKISTLAAAFAAPVAAAAVSVTFAYRGPLSVAWPSAAAAFAVLATCAAPCFTLMRKSQVTGFGASVLVPLSIFCATAILITWWCKPSGGILDSSPLLLTITCVVPQIMYSAATLWLGRRQFMRLEV